MQWKSRSRRQFEDFFLTFKTNSINLLPHFQMRIHGHIFLENKLSNACFSPRGGRGRERDEVGLGHKEQIALISKLWHVHGRKAESNLPVSFFSPLETIFASVSLSWYLYVHKLWSFEFYISLVIIFPCNVSVSNKFLYLLM